VSIRHFRDLVCGWCAGAPCSTERSRSHLRCPGDARCACARADHVPTRDVRAVQASTCKTTPEVAADRDPGPSTVQVRDWRKVMTTKQQENGAGRWTREQLLDRARKLKVVGFSAMNKAELLAAIEEANRAKATAAREDAPKAKAGPRPVASVDGIRKGSRVRMVRTVDLTGRSEGFAKIVEAGTEGVVEELRKSGPGVQAVVKASVGTFTLGVRHLEVVGS